MKFITISKQPARRFYNNSGLELFNHLDSFLKADFNKTGYNETAPVNVKEAEDRFVIEMIAPGFDKSEFSVNIDQDILTVSAEKKEAQPEDQTKWIRREFRHRPFKRSFTIDEKMDATKVEASYVNGILTLNLPKKEEVKESVRQIEIK